jgi:ABC-type transporter Mla subunit MlaD
MGNKQQQFDQFVQQVEQFEQQVQQQDQSILQTMNQLTSAVESINNQILQLKQQHVNMIEKQKQEEQLAKVKDQGYNEGYTDAEKLLTPKQNGDPSEIPDDMIEGLNKLSDDELQLILQENPDLIDLINKSQ